ncbi:MAG: flagellar biosynthetic protein FliR [Acidobacteria bacterium]|nr:flagellar biosynthetic protein FliR [Acidobacteriota bacterium]
MTELDVLERIGLLLARPGALIMAAPVMGGQFAPAPVRIGLAVILSFTMLGVVQVPAPPPLPALTLILLREVAIGTAIAMALRALIAAAEFGGHLSGAQMMLSYGSTIDPQGGVRNNIIASIYSNLAIFTFFMIDGHHALMRALAESYVSMPIGTGGVDGSIVEVVMRLLGVVFVLGFRLAAPLIVVLLIVEVAAGLLTRATPGLDLMALTTPVRVVVGLLAVSAVVPLVPGLVQRFVSVAMELGMAAAAAFR